MLSLSYIRQLEQKTLRARKCGTISDCDIASDARNYLIYVNSETRHRDSHPRKHAKPSAFPPPFRRLSQCHQMRHSATGYKHTQMKVFVVGGTGYLGSQVVKALAARKKQQTGKVFQLLALSRSERSDGVFHEIDGAIEARRGDLMDAASLREALRGVDVVISTAAGYTAHSKGDSADTDVVGIRNLVDACKANGVRRLVLQSVLECDKADAVPHFRHKYEQEQYAHDANVPFIAVRAPAFLDQPPSHDYLPARLPNGVYPAFFDINVACAWVHTAHLTRALLAAALDLPDDALGKRIPIAAQPAASGTDIAAMLTDLLGRPIVAQPVVPYFVLRIGSWLSASMADMRAMVDWVATGAYRVSDADAALQTKYFGPPPTLRDSFALYLRDHQLMN